jgi:hypothetical protein
VLVATHEEAPRPRDSLCRSGIVLTPCESESTSFRFLESLFFFFTSCVSVAKKKDLIMLESDGRGQGTVAFCVLPKFVIGRRATHAQQESSGLSVGEVTCKL